MFFLEQLKFAVEIKLEKLLMKMVTVGTVLSAAVIVNFENFSKGKLL